MSFPVIFRVRWFTQSGTLVPVPTGADPRGFAEAIAARDRRRSVTIEANGGEGQVQFVALGDAGVVWDRDDDNPSAVDLVARVWEVEGASEELGPGDSPGMLLNEFHEVAENLFTDLERPRLLTAEEVDTEHDTIVCWAVSLWDPADYYGLDDE